MGSMIVDPIFFYISLHLKSLIKHYKKRKSRVSIKLVISNNSKANGLIYAKQAKIKSYVLNFKKNNVIEKKLLKKLLKNNIGEMMKHSLLESIEIN